MHLKITNLGPMGNFCFLTLGEQTMATCLIDKRNKADKLILLLYAFQHLPSTHLNRENILLITL